MRKIFQRGFIWMVTPWFRLQIQNLEWRLIPQKLGLGPRSIRACFWKVSITFRPKIKYSNQNLSAGPSELTSPVCFETDKQNKTIEISIELSLEWKQQLSGPSEPYVWISNYWDLLEETTWSGTAVLDVDEPRWTLFKDRKPCWSDKCLFFSPSQPYSFTLLLRNAKGGMGRI